MKLFPADYYVILDDGTEIQPFIESLRKDNVRYRVVFHGIDTDFFSPVGLRGGEDFIVLFPHRPERWKRPDLAIEAFRRFIAAENPPKARLVMLNSASDILGEGFDRQNLDPRVEFVGQLDLEGVRNWLWQSSVVIGTSLESNMNRAISEAMACAKPVIVFDSGGTRKLVRHMFNGLLVPPGDTKGFAEQLSLLYRNPDLRERLGSNARKTIVEQRDWEQRLRAEIEVYRELVGRCP